MQVSSVLGPFREDVSRHVFRGGNLLMPRIFNSHRHELAVQAFPQELQTTVDQTIQNLTTAAATLDVSRAEVSGETLIAELSITNLAGHKLPSAYPSRRVWLNVTVRDSDGNVLFESGALVEGPGHHSRFADRRDDQDRHLAELAYGFANLPTIHVWH